MFVGQHEMSGTHMLIAPEGVCRGTGLHRLPTDKRWDSEFLKRCKGVPWDICPYGRETQKPLFGEGEQEKLAPIPPAGAAPGRPQRQSYVTKADIERYGPTDQ